MTGFSEEAPRAMGAATHQIGQELSALSVHELAGRIQLLREEIVRLEQEMARKDASRLAAEAAFRP